MSSSATLPHPVGIVIGRKVEIGDNVKILQNVTLGGRGGDHPPGMPTIQDNVTIEAGGIVLGDITLHQDCIVGANSVVLDDVGEGETVVGSPATKVD
jgi:serine O-acetyltransferase